VQISCFDIPSTYDQKVLKIYIKKRKPSFLMLSRIKVKDSLFYDFNYHFYNPLTMGKMKIKATNLHTQVGQTHQFKT